MGYTPVEDVPSIVASARETFNSGVTRSFQWRVEQLEALIRLVKENEQMIAAAITKDLRRPLSESLSEVWDIQGQAEYFKRNLKTLLKNEKLHTPINQKPMSYEVIKEPFGVVTNISPWNAPVSLSLGSLAGALAAGNAVVLKPSEVSVAANDVIAELVPKYMDTSAVKVVTGGVAETTALLAQKVDHILYTGNSTVARIVMAAAAKNLTPVTLELGGKNPAYVDESAKMDVTARRIVWTKCTNAGQLCIATDHVFVTEEAREKLIPHLKEEYDKMYPGEDKKDNPDMARIVNDHHFQRVKRLLEDHGGKTIIGGDMDEEERYMGLMVIQDPSRDSKLMQEEIFAPVLPLVTVKSMDEAIAITNSKPSPLAAYIYERDPKARDKWLKEVSSGGACVNDGILHVMNFDGGFGGRGESGMGRVRGRQCFESFTHKKVVGFQSVVIDPLSRYPPYEGVSKALKALLLFSVPAWVKPALWGAAGAMVAGAVALFSKYYSITVHKI